MVLMGIYGNVGSGKGLLTVYFLKCLLDENPKMPIYANFHLNFPNFTLLSPTMLFDIEKTDVDIMVVWDEGYVEMDNRESMSLANRINSYILFQQRKRNLSFIGISQLNILDIRWKGLERYAIIAHDRPIKDKHGKDSTDDFHYTITDGKHSKNFVFPYRKAKNYFQYYDTKEMVLPRGLDKLKEQIECADPIKLNALIDNYVEKIFEKYNLAGKVTRNYVKDIMLRLGLNLSYADYVYIRLNSKIE